MRKVEDAKQRLILEDQYGDWIRGSMPLEGRKGSLEESKIRNQVREHGKVNGEEAIIGDRPKLGAC